MAVQVSSGPAATLSRRGLEGPVTWLSWLVLCDDAHALAEPQVGPLVEVVGGFGAGGAPFHPGFGAAATVHLWAGRYDDQYAIGRYWSVGPTFRADYTLATSTTPAALRLAPLFEVRRGLELIVVGLNGFVGGGPLFVAPDDGELTLGATARAGLGLEYRRSRFWGVAVRLEGGADFVGDSVGAVAGALVGFQFSRPAREMEHTR